MKTAYNHLTHSYETPDKTTVAAEICEGDSPSDAFRAAAIREQQREPCSKCKGVGYYDEGHENDDGTMSGGNYVECDQCKTQ